jgi:aryl-alcohol dehydrogenase-like predicted oxidoreductase
VNIGLSNVGASELDEALELTPIAAVQNRCNLFERRDFETGFVAQCREHGVAYVAYSPVGGHFGHRRVADDATLARVATKHSTTPYAIALAWLLARADNVVPIPGASKVASATNSLSATRIALDADDLAALDALGGDRRRR